jgi:predicted ATPase
MVLYLCVLIVFSLHQELLKLILVNEPLPEVVLSQLASAQNMTFTVRHSRYLIATPSRCYLHYISHHDSFRRNRESYRERRATRVHKNEPSVTVEKCK